MNGSTKRTDKKKVDDEDGHNNRSSQFTLLQINQHKP